MLGPVGNRPATFSPPSGDMASAAGMRSNESMDSLLGGAAASEADSFETFSPFGETAEASEAGLEEEAEADKDKEEIVIGQGGFKTLPPGEHYLKRPTFKNPKTGETRKESIRLTIDPETGKPFLSIPGRNTDGEQLKDPKGNPSYRDSGLRFSANSTIEIEPALIFRGNGAGALGELVVTIGPDGKVSKVEEYRGLTKTERPLKDFYPEKK